jgi:hypothetical protein
MPVAPGRVIQATVPVSSWPRRSCGLICLGVALVAPGIARAASAVAVPGSAPAGVDPGALVGAVPASQQLTVQVWLTPDLAGATAFANSVATPGSSAFTTT